MYSRGPTTYNTVLEFSNLHCSLVSTHMHNESMPFKFIAASAILLGCVGTWQAEGTVKAQQLLMLPARNGSHPDIMHQHALRFMLSCYLQLAMCSAAFCACLPHRKAHNCCFPPKPDRLPSAATPGYHLVFALQVNLPPFTTGVVLASCHSRHCKRVDTQYTTAYKS